MSINTTELWNLAADAASHLKITALSVTSQAKDMALTAKDIASNKWSELKPVVIQSGSQASKISFQVGKKIANKASETATKHTEGAVWLWQEPIAVYDWTLKQLASDNLKHMASEVKVTHGWVGGMAVSLPVIAVCAALTSHPFIAAGSVVAGGLWVAYDEATADKKHPAIVASHVGEGVVYAVETATLIVVGKLGAWALSSFSAKSAAAGAAAVADQGQPDTQMSARPLASGAGVEFESDGGVSGCDSAVSVAGDVLAIDN